MRAAQGGDDAQSFAARLVRMYERFMARHNIAWDLLKTEQTPAGVRSWQVRIEAAQAHDKPVRLLIAEAGSHRIVHEVRGKRQTSFAVVDIEQLMHSDTRLAEADLKIERTRGSGPGGQHRNKVETAIRITHVPTGIQAYACSRSQAGNLALARTVLQSRVLARMQPDRDRTSTNGSFGAQRRSYRLHGPSQGVIDHASGRKAPITKVLDDACLELLA